MLHSLSVSKNQSGKAFKWSDVNFICSRVRNYMKVNNEAHTEHPSPAPRRMIMSIEWKAESMRNTVMKVRNIPLPEREYLFVHAIPSRYSLSYLVSYSRTVVNLFSNQVQLQNSSYLKGAHMWTWFTNDGVQSSSLKNFGSGWFIMQIPS
jgi:hypothetical protein